MFLGLRKHEMRSNPCIIGVKNIKSYQQGLLSVHRRMPDGGPCFV